MRKDEEVIGKAGKYLITSMVKKIEPVVVAEAEGATVTDVNGKEYIDCFSGISVTNAGHTQPEIIEAAFKQACKFVHVCGYVYYVPVMVELAEKLAEITPGHLQNTCGSRQSSSSYHLGSGTTIGFDESFLHLIRSELVA